MGCQMDVSPHRVPSKAFKQALDCRHDDVYHRSLMFFFLFYIF